MTSVAETRRERIRRDRPVACMKQISGVDVATGGDCRADSDPATSASGNAVLTAIDRNVRRVTAATLAPYAG